MKYQKRLFPLAFLLLFISVQCDTSFKSFDQTGGVLFTFQLPENTTLNDVETIKTVFSNRIGTYIKQQPKYFYNDTLQQLSVGVPKSLTSKSTDLTKKLLRSTGTFRTLPQYSKALVNLLDSINKITEMEDLVLASGDTSKIGLYTMLSAMGDGSFSHGHANNGDTALIRQILEHNAFASFFENEKNLVWTWLDEPQGRSSLHPYDWSKWEKGITETMVEKCELEKSDYGIFLTLELNEEGTKIFGVQTKAAALDRQQILVFIDKKLVLCPTVMEAITGGNIQISGDDDIEKMFYYQAIITSGKLPFKLELIREEIQ